MKKIISIIMIFTFNVFGQSLVIQGTVSTPTEPVRFASVTFVDANDTTRKLSTLTDSSGHYRIDIVTSVETNNIMPEKFKLEQNYPNPFSSSTNISYKLNKQSNIKVRIYNILGQLVKQFNTGIQGAGVHGIVWDGTNSFERKVAPGVYFYQLITSHGNLVKKMLYGFGSSAAAPLFPFIEERASKQLKVKNSNKSENKWYNIHIRGNENTQPRIFSEDYYSLIINNDTTLNFRVSKVVNDHHLLWIVGDGYDASIYDSPITAVAMKSTDGGLSWKKAAVTNTPQEEFWDVDFADSLNGWIVGDHRHIWHTSDGGVSWQLQYKPDPLTDSLGYPCVAIAAVDSLQALAATAGGRILRTNDGGASWLDSGPTAKYGISKIAYVDSSVMYAISPMSRNTFQHDNILKTENEGKTWRSLLTDTLYRFNDIHFINRDTGWACGERSITPTSGGWRAVVALTTDGGDNWDFNYITNYSTQTDAAWYFNPDTAIVINYGTSFYRTTDGGNTWSVSSGSIDPNIAGTFYSIKFTDLSIGWAIGAFRYGGGIIGKTNDGGISWFYLSTGYPYDFNFNGICIVK